MTKKSKVLVNSFFYTFSALLVKAISLLILPVYTFFLTPEDYGIINLVSSFTGVATFIVAFSIYSAVIRFYADYKDDREKLKRFYGTVIIFTFISGTIFISLGMIFKSTLISWFFEGISFYPDVLIVLLTLNFVSLHSIHQSILQGMQQGKKLTIINLVVFGIQVCLNLLLIAFFKLGASGVLLATFIINITYVLYMLIDLKKNNLVKYCIDMTLLGETLKYSVPLIPHNLSTNIASFASRVFMNYSGSLSLVGLYSVAFQFGALIDTVQTSVNKAFQPWFYNIMNCQGKENKTDVVSFSRFLLIVYSLMYMGIGLFSQEVIILMTNDRYTMAWTIIPILVVAFSVKSIYYFYVNVLFYHKDAARKIFIATIIGSFADIVFAYKLVPKYGMYGAAVAFLLAKTIIVSIIVFMSKRYDDIGYKVSSMLRIIIPGLLFMGGGLYFSYTKYITEICWMNLFYKIAIVCVYMIFIYLTNKKMINTIIRSGKLKQILKEKSGLDGQRCL
ncbi:oligosaccharide flippase family protein [Phosphitispora sp. TUW77]|uniref:oligosaccharide flippase family protein n=1 Tax=Phosphitispora sp. TUW77 TaxID=3152361 RepID=UPI003AB55A2D